ncbi:MAG TPA: hypothetical protein VGB85_09740 [Nannocystis sp.]
MCSPRRLALVALIGLGGCAARDTAASRAAWQNAVRGASPGGAGAGGSQGGRSDGGLADPGVWRDLATFTADTAELLALGVSTAPLATLVDKLCAEPPEEETGMVEPEAVRCPPKPAMDPMGHPLTLELGRHGSVGLVATDLSDGDSAALLTQALKQMAGACAGEWERTAGPHHEEFHTCTSPSGSMLVLGRFPGEGAGERWQFSLAVLGPG